MESPEKKGIPFEDQSIARMMLDALPDGVRDQFMVTDSRISPKDTKLHRAVFGVLDHYKGNTQCEAITNRLMAFYFLINELGKDGFGKWQKPAGDEAGEIMMLHPAVIEAIGVTPMAMQAVFRRKEFFETVERIAEKQDSEAT